MEIFEKKDALSKELENLKNLGKSIGFVPTMGALHEGHLSLLQEAIHQNDISVVSIFVNPTQFNNPEDFKKYPKTIDADLKQLELTGCDYVFMPDNTEMYPEPDTRAFNFGELATVMEGKHRPGHFNGVGQIVSKLFDVVKPHRAYFGQKDFQQVAIVKKLVELLNYDLEIVSCPIIREPDGLAMSSRNLRLSDKQRKAAPLIYETLKAAKHFAGLLPINQLKELIINRINKSELLDVEYVDIVDENTLKEPLDWEDKKQLTTCIAVFCGKIRLIDNMKF